MFPLINSTPEEKGKEEECERLHGRSLAKYLQRFSKHHRIFHLTVLASPGGSGGLCADQNAGMLNPLSSTRIKKEESVQVRRGSADFKGCLVGGRRGLKVVVVVGGCWSVPSPCCSLLFFAQSCKSKQEPLPELHCCGACMRACVRARARACCTVEMAPLSFYKGFHSARAWALHTGSLCLYLSSPSLSLPPASLSPSLPATA